MFHALTATLVEVLLPVFIRIPLFQCCKSQLRIRRVGIVPADDLVQIT